MDIATDFTDIKRIIRGYYELWREMFIVYQQMLGVVTEVPNDRIIDAEVS